MQFLADESCDFAVVRALRTVGHDVTAVKDIAAGATDEEVIRLQLDDNRILLTEDRDFGRLVFASAAQSPGVLYLRFPASTRKALVDTVIALVEQEGERLVNAFVVVQPGRVRITSRDTSLKSAD